MPVGIIKFVLKCFKILIQNILYVGQQFWIEIKDFLMNLKGHWYCSYCDKYHDRKTKRFAVTGMFDYMEVCQDYIDSVYNENELKKKDYNPQKEISNCIKHYLHGVPYLDYEPYIN